MDQQNESQTITQADVGNMADVLGGEPVTSDGAVASGETSDGSVSGSVGDSEGGEPDKQPPAFEQRAPEAGDAVAYWPPGGGAPMRARITRVWGPSMVNVIVLSEDNVAREETSVHYEPRDVATLDQGRYVTAVYSDSVPTLQAMQDALVSVQTPEAIPVCPPLTRLEEARALPDVGQDAVTGPCAFVPNTIQSFKSADGRTMRVVRVVGAGRSVWASQEVVRQRAEAA